MQMHLHVQKAFTHAKTITCVHKLTGDNSMMCTYVFTQSLPLLLTNQCSNTLLVSNICNITHGLVHYLIGNLIFANVLDPTSDFTK